jgi:hypothetical protein
MARQEGAELEGVQNQEAPSKQAPVPVSKMFKSLVRQDEAGKGKSASSNATYRETMMRLVEIKTPIALMIGRMS